MSSGVTAFFRLLPILPALARDRLAVVAKYAPSRSTTSVGLDVDPALVGERGGQDVALVEQPVERLRRRHVAEVEQHLVPEAGVQQVQHRVLDAADVQVDAARIGRPSDRRLRAHPVALDLGVDERVLVGRVEVAQVVPAANRPTAASCWCRGGTRCGPSPRSSSTSVHQSSADRAGSPGSENSSSGSNVRGEKLSVSGSTTGSIVSGSACGRRRRRRRSGTARPSSAAG